MLQSGQSGAPAVSEARDASVLDPVRESDDLQGSAYKIAGCQQDERAVNLFPTDADLGDGGVATRNNHAFAHDLRRAYAPARIGRRTCGERVQSTGSVAS